MKVLAIRRENTVHCTLSQYPQSAVLSFAVGASRILPDFSSFLVNQLALDPVQSPGQVLIFLLLCGELLQQRSLLLILPTNLILLLTHSPSQRLELFVRPSQVGLICLQACAQIIGPSAERIPFGLQASHPRRQTRIFRCSRRVRRCLVLHGSLKSCNLLVLSFGVCPVGGRRRLELRIFRLNLAHFLERVAKPVVEGEA